MADGQIIIDTSISDDGFKAGMKELEAAAKRMASSVTGMAKRTQDALSQQDKSFTKSSEAAKEFAETLQDINIDSWEANVDTEPIEDYENRVQQLKSQLEQLDREAINIEFAEGSLENVEAQLDIIEQKQQAIMNQDLVYDPSFEHIYDELIDQSEKLRKQMSGLLSRPANTENTMIDMLEDYASSAETATASNNEFVRGIEDLQRRLQEMEGAGKFFGDEDYDKAYLELQQLQQALKDYKKELVSPTGKTLQFDTSTAEGKIQSLTEELKQMREAGKSFGDTEFDSTYKSLIQAQGYLRNYRQELEDTARKEAEAASSASSLGSSIRGGLLSALNMLISKLKSAGNSIKNLVGNSIVSGFKNLGNNIKQSIPILKNIGSGMNSTGTAAKGLSKQIFTLGNMFKTMLLRSTVRAIISGAKEGFENLAQYSSETNQSISMLKSALTQLKNSFATAFAPVLNVVAPILTRLINMLSQAATYVGMFIAALTGKSTFTKAVAVQEDYAASLSDTASSAQEAEEALNSYLSPIDEINKVESQSSSSSGGGGGGGYTAPSVSDMFQEVPIASSLSDLANKIKELIAAEDWEGLGAFIAEKLNSVVSKIGDAISWDNVGDKITYFVNAFTRTFNSLVDNFDWANLGTTIGKGVNTIVNTINLLVDGIDWVNLGKSFATGSNGLLAEVDWGNLGKALTSKIKILWDTLYGFVTNFDWAGLGVAAGELLNGAVENIDLSRIGTTIGTGLSGVLEAIGNFAATFDWKQLGTNIFEGINSAIESIDFSGSGKAISDLLRGLLDTIKTALGGLDWVGLGKGIYDFLAAIDWIGIITDLSFIIGQAIGGLAALLWEVIGDAVISIGDYFGERIEECGGDIALGLLKGIGDALSDIWNWIKTNIFDPIVDGFKSIFGIHSPSTVFAELGGYLIEGLLNGITALVDSVIEFFSGLWQSIQDVFADVAEFFSGIFSEAWENIKLVWSVVTDFFSGIWDGITNTFNGVGSWFSEKFTDAYNFATGAWDTAKSTFSTIYNGVKDVFSGVGGWFSEKFTGAYDLAKSAWNGAKSGFSNVWSNIKSSFSNVSSWFGDTFSGAWEAVKRVFSTGGQIFDGIKDGILNGLKTVINAIIRGINKVVAIPFNGINKALSTLKSLSILGIKPFSWISTISVPQIPYLAKGGVIPPNSPFMAMLGDQKRGTNIEAPLDTIKQGVREVLGESRSSNSSTSYNFSAQINRRVLFDEFITEAKLRQSVTGMNPLELA